MRTHRGMFDELPFPARLRGHVVTPEAEPRIHGYAVRADLARQVSFLEMGWLALTGELPTPREAAAVHCALSWLAPLHVGEGPVHAAVLARLAGAPDAVMAGIAGVGIGQQTTLEMEDARALFAFLEGKGPLPLSVVEPNPDAQTTELQDELVRQSADWFGTPLPARPVLKRVFAAYAILYRLGISDELRLHAFSAWARLPLVLAEAHHTRAGAVRGYPARLPAYEYVED